MELRYLFYLHDRFFKNSMKRKAIAQGFVQLFLPERVTFKINYNSLEIEKDSWINALFTQHSSDVLYRVQTEGTWQHLLLLFEHKSYVDNSVALENF